MVLQLFGTLSSLTDKSKDKKEPRQCKKLLKFTEGRNKCQPRGIK